MEAAFFVIVQRQIFGVRGLSLSAFIDFIIHYLTKEFELVSWNLEVQKFEVKHSGERICEVLQKIIIDWDLNKANMVLMVRDYASNGALETRLLDIDSFGFIAAHSFYLVLAPLGFQRRNVGRL